jgi:hypothetical protein
MRRELHISNFRFEGVYEVMRSADERYLEFFDTFPGNDSEVGWWKMIADVKLSS